MHTLFGDGVHDGTDAIQELIDSGACEVCLPAPQKRCLISRPLEHSARSRRRVRAKRHDRSAHK